MKKRIIISSILILLIVFLLIFLYLYEDKEKEIIYKGKYIIINETKDCDESLKKIGEDHTYIYYLKCADPKKVFLVFENKARMSLSNALEEKFITLKEIEEEMKDNLFIESISKKELKEEDEEEEIKE